MALYRRDELRQQIRLVTDTDAATLALEQAHHVSDTFLNDRINTHGPRLFRKIQRARSDFVIRQKSYPTEVGKEFYALPDEFLSLLRVRAYDGSNYYDMDRFAFGPQDSILKQFEASGGSSSHAGLYHYHVVTRAQGKRDLWIQPTPQVTTHTLEIIFTPIFDTLDIDSDQLDGFDGWEQYLIYAVALDVFARTQGDPSTAMLGFQSMDHELDAAIIALDLARVECVRDTAGDGYGGTYPNVWPSSYSDV